MQVSATFNIQFSIYLMQQALAAQATSALEENRSASSNHSQVCTYTFATFIFRFYWNRHNIQDLLLIMPIYYV